MRGVRHSGQPKCILNAFCPTERLHSLGQLRVLPDGCYMQDTF